MPHSRPRYARPLLEKAAKYSAIVGLLGQRQVGKTTLLESSVAEYVSFDRSDLLGGAMADPEFFLENRKRPLGIDEAQLCEPLFPAMKEHVRVHKGPGQFFLSGSVRFTSKKSIRESLTGRIVNVEILPFSISEARQEPLPRILERLLAVSGESGLAFLESSRTTAKQFESFLECGGLPGISFFRDAHIRASKFESHLDTLLNRDIRQIYSTTLLYSSLRALLEYLARHQGRPFELKAASQASQISTVSLKRALFALEGLFLIRSVLAQGERKPTFFLEDQGMASWLKGVTLHDADDVVRGLYANLRQEQHYRPELNGRIFQWRTKNAVNVPLVFSSRQGTIGIIPTVERRVAPKVIGSAQSFLRKFPKAKVVIAYGGTEIVSRGPSMAWVPYWLLC